MIPHPLSLILFTPLLGIALIGLIPAKEETLIRRLANGILSIAFLLSVYVFAAYDHSVGGYQFVEKTSWVKALGISYHLGVDGINALLVLLVGLGSLAAVLISSTIKERVKEYYLLLLLMIAGTFGAFLSLDIFFFFFLHEIATIPTFLMIALWGSKQKDEAAMKITLYLTLGASIALIGLIALYLSTGLHTFDFVILQQALAYKTIPLSVQFWIFPLIVFGFGITLTLWPFYTWAPIGYSEAPTAVSMLHAGVIKKLGAYAIIRFAISLMPEAAHIWMPIIASLAVLNIVYCGFVALTQRDIKYILAYSSCSHMGYILLGLACMSVVGLNGVVFLMFAHGVMSALGFALAGFVTDQTKTRNIHELGGLTKAMPFVSTLFIMTALASAGVPGFGNFVAEILVLLGTWDQYQVLTVLAILGIVITAIYMLKTIRLGFQGPFNIRFTKLTDATTLSQRLPYVLLMAALILVGCLPSIVLQKIAPATKAIVKQVGV